MRYFPTLSTFAASALALYAPGEKCTTNTECNDECFEGRWTIAKQPDDNWVLVCDPDGTGPGDTGPDDTAWQMGICYTTVLNTETSSHLDTLEACDRLDVTVCGFSCVTDALCGPSCILSGKKAEAESTRVKFEAACKAADAKGGTMKRYDSKADAEEACLD